jgi:hypothetical protein
MKDLELKTKLKAAFDATSVDLPFAERMKRACAVAGTPMRNYWRYPSQAPWVAKTKAGKRVKPGALPIDQDVRRDVRHQLTLDDAIQILSGVIAGRVAAAIGPRIERELALRITSAAAAQAPQVKRGPEKPAGKKPNDMSDAELIAAIHLAKKEERYADITPMIAVLRRREQGANAVAMALRDGAED